MSQVAFEIAIIFLLIVELLAVVIAASLLRPARRAAPARVPETGAP